MPQPKTITVAYLCDVPPFDPKLPLDWSKEIERDGKPYMQVSQRGFIYVARIIEGVKKQ